MKDLKYMIQKEKEQLEHEILLLKQRRKQYPDGRLIIKKRQGNTQ